MCAGNFVTASGACLNPAIGFGTSFTMLFDWNNYYGIELIWLYAAIPFGGSVLAIIFYELIFRKTQEVLNEDHQEEEDVDTLLDK